MIHRACFYCNWWIDGLVANHNNNGVKMELSPLWKPHTHNPKEDAARRDVQHLACNAGAVNHLNSASFHAKRPQPMTEKEDGQDEARNVNPPIARAVAQKNCRHHNNQHSNHNGRTDYHADNGLTAKTANGRPLSTQSAGEACTWCRVQHGDTIAVSTHKTTTWCWPGFRDCFSLVSASGFLFGWRKFLLDVNLDRATGPTALYLCGPTAVHQ